MKVSLPQEVCLAADRLLQSGFSVYLVGGCLRALLMGMEPHDYDLATDARPEQVLSVFHSFKVSQAGQKHGTIMVIIGNRPIEITTLRIDGTYSDRRRPDQVRFTNEIQQDLSRRDFTMNAIAWPLPAGCYHEGQNRCTVFEIDPDQLIDPFGGVADLKAGLIRCVGDPEQRFSEDALRILRALRFKATLGFRLEEKTKKAVHHLAFLLRDIAVERILIEFSQILCGDFVEEVLIDFPDVLTVFIPELEPLTSQPDLWIQTARRVARTEPIFALRLASLLRDLLPDSSSIKTVVTRLRCDSATRRRVLNALSCLMDKPQADERAVCHWMRRHGAEPVMDALLLLKADETISGCLIESLETVVKKILSDGYCYRIDDLAIRGSDLLQLGLKPGPRVGQILNRLLDQVIDGQIENDREALLEAAALEIKEDLFPSES